MPALVRQPLLDVLRHVPDPRHRRGVRHQIPVILACALAAITAGSRTLVAIGEWIHDTDPGVLAGLGIGPDVRLPSESAIRRTLARLDPEQVQHQVDAWAWIRTGQIGGRRVIAVDPKSMRGAGLAGAMPHLVAALDHASGVVLGQQQVGAKTDEIPALRDLGGAMDIAGCVVTADALHTQRDTARFLVGAGADYVLTVKANQPHLLAACRRLPWGKVPGHPSVQTGHGRRVRRTVKAVAAPGWIDFPGAGHVLQIRRTVTRHHTRHVEVVHLLCSATMLQPPPQTVAGWLQGHWGIGTRLHWVRDVTFDEDRHQLRVCSGPSSWRSFPTPSSPHCAWQAGPASPPAYATTPGHPERITNLLANP